MTDRNPLAINGTITFAPRSPAARAAEFHSLIEHYAHYERSVRLSGWKPDDNDRAAHQEAAARLAELADLLNATQSATYDVAEAVERWIASHPLSMTGTGMKRVIDQSSDGGNGVAVGLQIGDPAAGGRFYPLHEGQFACHSGGRLQLTLPNEVAEEFRQQGRRACQREIANVLGLEATR